MSNLVPDPGFELDLWTLSGKAARVTDTVRSGTYALRLQTLKGFSPGTGSAVSPSFAVASGQSYAVALGYYPDEATEVDLIVEVDPGTGTWVLFKRLSASLPNGWSRPVLGEFTAVGTTARLRLRTDDSDSLILSDDWHIDDVLVELVPEVITKAVRDALVDDLETVTTANGYEITARKVYPEPILGDQRTYPFYEVQIADGDSESTELGSRGGESTQVFEVRGGVDSDAPMTDLMKLLDSMRNAIEKSTSNLCALSSPNVVTAAVSGWTLSTTDDGVSQGRREFTADVTVAYSYTRGSA